MRIPLHIKPSFAPSWRTVIRVAEGGPTARNHIMERLAERAIQTRPGTHAVHRLGYYRDKYGFRAGDFPVAAASEDETITLPIFPGITEGQQAQVVQLIREALIRHG